ncbi:NAD(P)H-dependent flavin oxidoreductase [Clostridium felsineum]|uniref:Probable nitronate monooxygenase n=1 Tax=Clostridium felsineum TaxID=36839 RepID=A0A1S8MA48_9CLOT|nr:nitronate monooxygenase family protein [Clostridium felsineum]MCR3757405.1 nitronate monooxygenase family protein [Clostridium felsineum]URZ02980.1 Nitronate monooxygenase [Clostridium felsineum]URZ08685.1 Nitronate monooxygenase [Clostridium felsineum]URZ13715.1 Nitronate monooxygenase [Clostridium felsineum]
MKLPPLKIGDLIADVPIIQGGMGVGISRSSLASAVANCGGVGTISGVQIGFDEPDFETNTFNANIRALNKHIKRAKESSKRGIIAVNFMVAMNDYDKYVKNAVEAGVDLIVSGAGLPTALPKIVEGSSVKIAPVVSSPKAAAVICKMWDKHHGRIPDLIVVEGPEAGGHLGFKKEEVGNGEQEKLENILVGVLEAIKPFEEKHKVKIPVVCGGGVFYGKDIAKYIKLGASGVQMATRFIATEECDADIKYKNMYVNCEEGDIKIVKSPVGMPGRAISNRFVDENKGNVTIDKCYNCLKPCNPKSTPYCISKALINAVKGNIDEALLFTGAKSYKIDKIVKVKDLINELVSDAEKEF